MTIRRCGGEKIHTVHAERDLVANWEVDLSEKLQEYLLKICSGELAGDYVGDGQVPVNFAEAALLLQGSVQVYSKKVEYLYNLVLRTLEFLSKQREKEQSEDTVNEGEESSSPRVDEDEYDLFWNVDNITVDAKNSLDNSVVGDSCPSQFVKPPANLGVLKGDCLDTMGEGGELGSYMLATTHLYKDFILLYPCDVLAVNEFLGDNSAGNRKNSGYSGSSVHKSFHSLQGRSGGSARSRRSSTGKNQGADSQNCGQVSEPHPVFGEKGHGFDVDAEHGGAMGLSDTDPDEDDNPPKPLSAYESGNLKVKPFKKVKTFREVGWRVTIDHMASMIPLATEFNRVWEKWRCATKDEREEEEVPCFEKLRALLVNGGNQPFDSNGNHKDADKDNHKEADGDDHEHAFMDEDGLRMNGGGAAEFHNHDGFGKDESYCQESLEDLCQSHLDAILANIAKSEKQTDLSARVSSWKQKVEQNLEEQELHTPFDIKEYGETIINILTVEESGSVETFTDLMKDQEKHNVARAFSALLQLLNNGDVELEKPGNSVGEPVCYTSVNPFGVRLLNRKVKKITMDLPRKRAKSPITKGKPHESPPSKKPNTCSVSRQTQKVSLKISKI